MNWSKSVAMIKSDFSFHREPGFLQNILVIFYNPSFRLLLNYRIGCFLFNHKYKLYHKIARYYKYRQITKRGCHISYEATLGHGIKFPHPLGIVIGDGVIIGDNVRIYQQVTLGSHGKPGEGFSYPVVRENVKIYAGAKLFGGIEIGNDAIIGANAVVNISVPAFKVAVGIPAVVKD